METRLAWLAAIFSGIAAIGGILVALAGFWTAYETRQQTRIENENAQLDRTGVVTRMCDEVHSALMQTGQDLFNLDGLSGKSDYIEHEERTDLLAASSRKPTYFLECQLTNASRVPIFDVTFYSTVLYHNARTSKRQQNDDPIEVIEPEQTRTYWIENLRDSSVRFYEPDEIRYYRFPDMQVLQDQKLLPLEGYYWTLRRNRDPKPIEPL